MGKREYRLRNVNDQLSEDQREMFRKEAESYFSQLNMLKSEAVYLDKFIYLPDGLEIDDPSKVKIDPIKKHKIDYIAKLPYKELREELKERQKRDNLLQKDLHKITSTINKYEKELIKNENDSEARIEELIKFLEKTTEGVVNEKQVKKYVGDIEKYSDKLIDCLFLDNPEMLENETKREILNKMILLQSCIEDLKTQLLA